MKHAKLFKEFLNEALNEVKPHELLNGEWKIEDVIAISNEEPSELDEVIVIGADFGNANVARGKKIYITARISKGDESANRNQIAVIETRIVNIFQSLNVLNQIKNKKV